MDPSGDHDSNSDLQTTGCRRLNTRQTPSPPRRDTCRLVITGMDWLQRRATGGARGAWASSINPSRAKCEAPTDLDRTCSSVIEDGMSSALAIEIFCRPEGGSVHGEWQGAET